MHPLYARQLAAATGADEHLDLAALAAEVSATYARMDRRRARAIARGRHLASERLARDAELKRLFAELEAQNERFAAALENMSQGLCFFDGEQRLIICNQRYAEMYGLLAEHVRPGTSLSEIVDRRFEVGSCPAMTRAEYLAWRDHVAFRNTAHTSVVELRNGRVFAIRHQPMPDGGWVSTHEDVTEQRQAETRIAHMARHDALTGLANRVLLRERLDEVLARTRGADPCAVLWLDLDQFKSINDTEGHTTGDALLRAAAARMRRLVRETDTIARIGGDEFAVVQSNVGQPAGATALAARLVHELGLPFQIGGQQFVIGASIGIAIAPADGLDADQLLKNADIALYRAKAEGRARYRLFEPAMDALMQARRTLELDLRKALAEEEFELFYQPLVRVETRQVSGFEALIRWRHRTRGLVSPGEFIPFAEETGLVTQLDEWVLRAACREAAGWQDELSVAVNLSAAHFRSDAVIATVAAALEESGLRPDRLEIEITESMMIENSERALASLHQLRNLGTRISMDDFGTGYSSLGYLRNFRFDKIKIDQSFVRELATRPDCIAIIRAVTSLCRSLGMATTAEGVETGEQFAALVAENCTEVQGYLFSRPLPASEIPELLVSLSPDLAAAA
ncbi:MAG TPA: EAL domain-containing protein [Acetobacteraceae bacterium]|nr:EAL domain-containing protein [Acetobacteraceae bacterium]